MRWRRLWKRPCQICGRTAVARITTLGGTWWLCRVHFEDIGVNLLNLLKLCRLGAYQSATCNHHDFCSGNHDNQASDFWCPHDENCEDDHG